MLPERIKFRNNPLDRKRIVKIVRESFKNGRSVAMCISYGGLNVICYLEASEELKAKMERTEFPIFEGELKDADERMKRIIENYERDYGEVVLKNKYYKIKNITEEVVEEEMYYYI
ncbi:hypothetical protein [Candidatus Alkanophaga liquidiphilum]|nr:hypothetical protein [Candidatus Alkanophaga liquidiphilum]RLG38334.1 MAG: hypothetical protein DRN91_02950 [Candidatus Alkanophagales archaeon]